MESDVPGTDYTENWQGYEDPAERKKTYMRLAKRKSRQKKSSGQSDVDNRATLKTDQVRTQYFGEPMNSQRAVCSNEADVKASASCSFSLEPLFDMSAVTENDPMHNVRFQVNDYATRLEPLSLEESMSGVDSSLVDPMILQHPMQTDRPHSLDAAHLQRWSNSGPYDLAEGSQEPDNIPSFLQLLSQVQQVDHPSFEDPGELQAGIEHLLKTTQEMGFDTLDPLINAYYTATLDENTAVRCAQSSSRIRHLGPLIRAIHENSKTWSQAEYLGFKAELLRTAEDLYIAEFRSLSRSQHIGEGRLYNSFAQLIAGISLEKDLKELRRYFQDAIPSVWSLLFALVSASATPEGKRVSTAAAILAFLSTNGRLVG